jgi:hypothetical protein
MIFGFYVRVFERVVDGSSFVHTYNGGWLIILTMTTIGYGEIFPVTHLGRFAVIVACIVGVFLLSLFVVALANTVEFEKDEEESHFLVKKDRFRQNELRKIGIVMI